ncbi:hypothetical protein IMSAGC015_01704 [Lachnospiraceae bacterium]|nr:hypothetical protein IMSAGC015_01704 [Lachnospiraceae bacterium]
MMPKRLRAFAALEAGVAAVFELPVFFACGSAEYFAEGAIALLDALGCVDAICFGSECGDVKSLGKIAKILADEPEEYSVLLRNYLKSGLSYPRARQAALKSYFKDGTLDMILEQPNNILGIEYMKALYKKNSTIRCCTIRRVISGYHDEKLLPSLSSAAAIRKALAYGEDFPRLTQYSLTDGPAPPGVLLKLKDQVPHSCLQILKEYFHTRYPVYANDFSLLLKYRLLSETKETLTQYTDISEDLANRIINRAGEFLSFSQFCSLLKTRELTYARISRCLMHIILGITASDLKAYQKAGYCQYAHILGFRKDSTNILSVLKQSAKVPLITRPARAEALSDTGLSMLQHDIFASNLYESIITDKFKTPFINEYQHQVIKI